MRDRPMIRFVFILWLIIGLAWLGSGERFIDWAFGMPEMGPVDDALLAVLVVLDEWRAALGIGDGFGALRALLHAVTGLG